MAAGRYTVFMKNGDFGWDNETGSYADLDLSLKTKDFSEALRTFLEYVQDVELNEEGEISLSFSVKPKGKKG